MTRAADSPSTVSSPARPDRFVEDGRLLDPFGGIDDVRGNGSVAWGTGGPVPGRSLRIVRAIRLKNERRGFRFPYGTASAIPPPRAPSPPAGVAGPPLGRTGPLPLADPAGTIGRSSAARTAEDPPAESGRHANRAAERIASRYRFLRRSLGVSLPAPPPSWKPARRIFRRIPPLAAARDCACRTCRSVASNCEPFTS